MSLGGTHKAKNRLPLPVTYFRRVFLAKFGFLGGGVENDDFRGFSGFSGVFAPPQTGGILQSGTSPLTPCPRVYNGGSRPTP